jgi:hypothetical protein
MSRKAAAKAGEGSAKAKDKGSGGKKPKAAKAAGAGGWGSRKRPERLRPGQLDGLVLSFMRENEKGLPMSPGSIANGIGRSSGAVGNCLERLAKAKKARLAKKAPREYDLKGSTRGAGKVGPKRSPKAAGF